MQRANLGHAAQAPGACATFFAGSRTEEARAADTPFGMVTKRRPHTADATYHVRSRGIDGRPIFVDDNDREFYLSVLDRTLPRLGACALQWVLIPNHAHLKLKVTSVPLSLVMHAVGTEYAMYFNERHASAGHVFQDRYWRKIVDDPGYGAVLSGYLPANVIEAGLATMADLDRYPWCGYGAVMGTLQRRPFHRVDLELQSFARDPSAARRIVVGVTEGAVERMLRRRARTSALLEDIIEDARVRNGLDLDTIRHGRFREAEQVRRQVIQHALAAGIPTIKIARGLGLDRTTVWRHTRR
jgi:REP element-mobilizing transposase RayT